MLCSARFQILMRNLTLWNVCFSPSSPPSNSVDRLNPLKSFVLHEIFRFTYNMKYSSLNWHCGGLSERSVGCFGMSWGIAVGWAGTVVRLCVLSSFVLMFDMYTRYGADCPSRNVEFQKTNLTRFQEVSPSILGCCCNACHYRLKLCVFCHKMTINIYRLYHR